MSYPEAVSTTTPSKIVIHAREQAGQAERRAVPRWPVRIPVLHGIQTPSLVTMTADVSEQGARFLTRTTYAIGTVLSLELRIPSGPIQLRAQVAHCQAGKTGVQFLNLSHQQRIELLDFCFAQIGETRN